MGALGFSPSLPAKHQLAKRCYIPLLTLYFSGDIHRSFVTPPFTVASPRVIEMFSLFSSVIFCVAATNCHIEGLGNNEDSTALKTVETWIKTFVHLAFHSINL